MDGMRLKVTGWHERAIERRWRVTRKHEMRAEVR